MNLLIGLSETHFIVVDTTIDVSQGEKIYHKNINKICDAEIGNESNPDCLKITHSTIPLVDSMCCIAKEGLTAKNKGCRERNRCLCVEMLPLTDIEEIIQPFKANTQLEVQFIDGKIKLK